MLRSVMNIVIEVKLTLNLQDLLVNFRKLLTATAYVMANKFPFDQQGS